MSTALNVFRQVFFLFSVVLCVSIPPLPLDIYTTYVFNSLPLAGKVGIQDAWIVFAFIVVALFIPVVVLMFFGAHLRSLPWQSPPRSSIGSYPVDSNSTPEG